MIKSITLINFFSFKKQTIDLTQKNLIVGINGSGKSNFIKALRVLKATITEGELEELIIDRWGGFDSIYHSGVELKQRAHFCIEYEFNSDTLSEYGYKFQEPIFYKISFYKMGSSQNYTITEILFTKTEEGKVNYQYMYSSRGKGNAREGKTNDQHIVEYELSNMSDSMLCQLKDSDRYYQIYTVRQAIADISIYSYFDTTESSKIRKPSVPSRMYKLSSDGSNLPQILNWIKINNKGDYRKITESLSTINPKITGFDFNILGTNIELLLEEDNLNRSVHVTHISDGTLRYLCLMAIIHNSVRGRLVCIDEPEVGLHPDMIGEIMSSIDEIQGYSQFIICTHDELLLNQSSVSDLIVFEKDDSNATIVKTFRDEEFVEWAEGYTTGSLWRNGDLGGNRY